MSFPAKTKSDKIAVTVIKIQWRQASRRKIAFRALRLTHGVRRRASLTIFNVLAAFTSDYRPRNPSSTQRISAKQAEISRWRLTRGGHKGNRAIIVNRLNLPPFPLNLPRTKRKRKERERERARRKLSGNRLWSHPLLHHPLISGAPLYSYGICIEARCTLPLYPCRLRIVSFTGDYSWANFSPLSLELFCASNRFFGGIASRSLSRGSWGERLFRSYWSLSSVFWEWEFERLRETKDRVCACRNGESWNEYMQNGNLFFFVVTFICDRIDLTRFRASCRKNISWKFWINF